MQLAGLRLERARASTQFRDGRFHNTHPADAKLEGPRGPIFREFLFERGKRKPPGTIEVASPLDAWTRGSDSGLRITWLGHSTMLVESDGVRVLTDPVFGDRIGPASFLGPKRFHARPVEIAQLPKLDAILVSHDHFDHLCKPSIGELAKLRVPFVTSLGVGAYLERYGAEHVTELDWWETARIGGVAFTATPAQHFSGRVGGRNATLWSSWVIETERRRLFFSGDTGLTPEFADVRARVGAIDVAMLEVGAWHPAWGTIHLGPVNALAAHELLGARALMPVHWGTFDLGLHGWAEPAEELFERAAATGVRLLTPRLGVPFEPEHAERATPWWREVGHAAAATDEPVPA
jgi:L-ascorbate metabolism protein UlaG (beta-lactamase superfamily)|nr:MBL fold metallo-hydrolase [Kofleriaceae bacterium]